MPPKGKGKSKKATWSSSSQREAAPKDDNDDEDAAESDEEDDDVDEEAQAKSKGNVAKSNQPHSSKRQTKKQLAAEKEAAKYGRYFDTQEDEDEVADAKDGQRGGASPDAMDDAEGS